MFPFDFLTQLPEWIPATLGGLAFGLNLGAWVARRGFRKYFDLNRYTNGALVEMIDWANAVLAARKAEGDKESCSCGDRLVDCSTCPQRKGVDSHGQSGSGATGSIPACGAGDEGSNPSSGTMKVPLDHDISACPDCQAGSCTISGIGIDKR